MITWIEDDVSLEDLPSLVKNILGCDVHPAALKHLSGDTVSKRIPFPRLEKHIGYLFGITYLPANTENPSADFDGVVFAATHDSVVAKVILHPTSNLNWSKLKLELSSVNSEDSTSDGGEFLLNLFRETIKNLWKDAENIRIVLDRELDIGKGSELLAITQIAATHDQLSTTERRALLEELNGLAPTMSIVSAEMNQMMRVAVESETILSYLCADEDQYDLREDLDGNERELFSTDLEIYLADTWELCRTLVATLEEIEAKIDEANTFIRALSNEENVAASRFTGAIASLLLVPTFIVGLYGQNFVSMPERNWANGYAFSWGLIALVTFAQFVFFRKRGWI